MGEDILLLFAWSLKTLQWIRILIDDTPLMFNPFQSAGTKSATFNLERTSKNQRLSCESKP